MKKGFFLACLFAAPAFSQNYQIHVLEEGETLSEVLYEKGYKPLYGEGQWVEKTLKMNHLTSVQDKELKKGFPIILPALKGENDIAKEKIVEKTIFEEKVVYQAEKRTGLLAGFISKHQNVYLNFGHSQSQSSLPSTTFSQAERFNLGIDVEGKNRHRIGRLIYDINAGIQVGSQGNGTFEGDSTRTAALDPRMNIYTEMQINSPGLAFDFGPRFSLEERSRVTESQSQDYDIRRDRIVWAGFMTKKEFQTLGSKLIGGLDFQTSFLQNSVDGNPVNFSASQVNGYANIQVANEYYVGLGFNQTQYNDINLNSEQSLSFNFRYELK
ncbi:MAG: hypothetical protein CME65_10030 [Halobacteriovoraceae bacterium]|nr:hypothetical protein [Halobacteriovoraceae bacterium]|tara:strand:+ start:3355 stop:4332 length:978 start_codon:yes stop_codon:yes gene_type:complete